MTRRRNILVFTLLLAACSAPDDPTPDTGMLADGGDDLGDDLGTSAVSVDPGLYNGTADSDDAALALWPGVSDLEGRLLVGEELGFVVNLGEPSTLTPLDGACSSCAAGPWAISVEEVGPQLRVTVIDEPGPGFVDLRLLPSDGFKPEFSPGPDLDVWSGEFFALSPAVDPAVLQSTCELSVDRESGQVASFSCQRVDTDSAWAAEISHSWASDDEQGFFQTDAASFVGDFGGDPSYETFEGQILINDEVVGAFEMVKLN